MKRGLVAAAGESAPVYAARLERMRARVREAGAVAALVYGDVYRSDDIAHLTNLCIYWNEGVLAVPAEGPPAFLAKLSARVHPWMRRTSVLEDLRASQKLAQLIASYLDELGAGPVALVDEDWWPADLVADVRAATPDRATLALVDAIREGRLVPDERDLADLRRAGEIVAGALAAAKDAEGAVTERIAALEFAARGAGARDVLVHAHSLGDGALALELTVQYANVWASAARTFGGSESADAGLQAARAALVAGSSPLQIARAAGEVELALVHHCDLGSAGDYRPATDVGRSLAGGEVVAVTVRSDGAVAGDTFHISAAGALPLTAAAEVTA